MAKEMNLPLRWSATENVRWKVALPDRGNSTPIVWNERVFVTQAIEKEGRRLLLCFARADGKLLWEAGTTFQGKEDTHPTNPYCSASPVTDGERVIAWFGSAGVYSFDFNGKELWRAEPGQSNHEWGYAASPVLHGEVCVLNFGAGDRTFLVALNKQTGKKLWQADLPEPKPTKRTDGFAGQEQGGMVGSWSTPILVTAGVRDELVVSSAEQLRAYDPSTGKLLWVCDGLNPLVYASPIYGEGVVVAMGGFLGTTIAVKPGGQGNVTATHRLWQKIRTKNRLGSGVIHGGYVYILNTEGVAECLDLKTGKMIWEERLKGKGPKSESWSCMVLAGENIYVLNQSGDTIVLKASPRFEVLGVNSLGNELTNASLAVSNGDVFVRTHKNLWCFSEAQTKPKVPR